MRWEWSKTDGRRDLRLVWHESGGAVPEKSPAAGLGSDLIDHAIPGASVHRELHPDGLVCTIKLTIVRGTSADQAVTFRLRLPAR